MKNFIKLIFLSSLFLILLYGCKKELGEFLLDGLKNQNPYTGTETLCFIDNNDDSILFYGNGRYSEIFHTQLSHYDDYYVNEQDICYFLNDSEINNGNNIKYELEIYMATHLSSSASMVLYLTSTDLESGAGCKFYSWQYAIPLVDHYKNTRFYIDSLKVLDKYYRDVIVDSALWYQIILNGDCLDPNTPKAIFYTPTDGFIKIDFNDGNTWSLKSIIR